MSILTTFIHQEQDKEVYFYSDYSTVILEVLAKAIKQEKRNK